MDSCSTGDRCLDKAFPCVDQVDVCFPIPSGGRGRGFGHTVCTFDRDGGSFGTRLGGIGVCVGHIVHVEALNRAVSRVWLHCPWASVCCITNTNKGNLASE